MTMLITPNDVSSKLLAWFCCCEKERYHHGIIYLLSYLHQLLFLYLMVTCVSKKDRLCVCELRGVREKSVFAFFIEVKCVDYIAADQ